MRRHLIKPGQVARFSISCLTESFFCSVLAGLAGEVFRNWPPCTFLLDWTEIFSDVKSKFYFCFLACTIEDAPEPLRDQVPEHADGVA